MRFHIKSILTKLKTFIKHNQLATLLIVALVVLRFINLNSHVTFLGDQGRDAIIMKRMVTFEHFPAIGAPTSIGMVYLGPFYYYFMAPWLLLFNFNPLGPAFGVAFLSVILGLWAYYLIYKHFNSLTALFFLFFLAFSNSNISLSRFSWNPNLLPIFTFFTLFAFYQVLYQKSEAKNNSRRFLWPVLFGSLFSFSFQLHYLVIFMLPTFLLFFTIRAKQTKQLKSLLTKIALSVFSFVFFSIPLLIFDLRHQFLNFNNLLKLFNEGNVTSQGSYWQRFQETLVGFWQHTWQFTVSPFWAMTLFILLLVMLFKFGLRSKSNWYFLNLANLLFFIFGFASLNSGRFEHYYGPVYFSLFLTLGFVFSYRFKNCAVCRIVIPIFLLIFLAANFLKFKVYFQPGGNQIKHSQTLAKFLATKTNNQPFNIATWPVQFTEDNYLYFMELYGQKVLDRKKLEIAKQMFVLCNEKSCQIINSPSWNIAMFGKAKVAKIWNIDGIRIFKLKHTL